MLQRPNLRRSPGVLSRRNLLQVGSLAFLGLGLPQLLSAASSSRTIKRGIGEKSCIFVVQYGGASHIDTLDPKPSMPAEIRGPYLPIATSAPGMKISSMLPRLAKLGNKIALIRSMTHGNSGHDMGMHTCMTGKINPREDTPYYGSLVAKLRPSRENIPSYVWLQNLAGDVQPWYLKGGILGASFGPMLIGKDEANLANSNYRVTDFEPQDGVTGPRLQSRRELLDRISPPENSAKTKYAAGNFRKFQDRALELVTSPRARSAFDLQREPEKVRDWYGRHALGQNLLMARRLIEAGVRLVTVNAWCGRASPSDVLATQGWDHHGAQIQKCGIFDTGTFGLGFVLPRFDQALSSLLQDLDQRGLLASTLVVVVGEFGRTPKITKIPYAGRDHWPQCYSALMAGAGCRGGAIYGSSDKQGAFVKDYPVTPTDFAATLFHTLGIPPDTRYGPDGFSLKVSDGKPIRGLFA